MTRVGFLACETTLPGSGERRGDAFEHDLMIAALAPAFADAGLELEVIGWEAPLDHFAGVDLVLLGTAWDYQDNAEAFLAKLGSLEASGVAVCNSSQVVRWNINKTYLQRLAQSGVASIPTLWPERVDRAIALQAMDALGCDRLVVKRQVGAGALGQELLERGAIPTGWQFNHPAMLQPFLSAIAEEGEISFIFIDGAFSHTVLKRPAKGEYRIQSLYGGREDVYLPSTAEVEAATSVISALPFDPPLYARIDMLRGDDASDGKNLMVMEAEMIEPYLYPEQGPHLGERLAAAIVERASKL